MKNAWDKIILLLVLTLVTALATALALFAPNAEEVTGVPNRPITGTMVQPLKAETLQELGQKLSQPVVWEAPPSRHGLFVGPKILFKPDTLEVMPYDEKAEYKGILISWLDQYGIALSDSVALEDPDHDGFSNKVEFEAKTVPTDPKSHPAYITCLRMQDYEEKKFLLRFQSYNEVDGKMQFTIKAITEKKNYFKYAGDDIRGFKLKEFRPKVVKETNAATGETKDTDRSELDLYNDKINLTVTLILDKDINSPDYTANFIMLLPGETEKVMRIKRGDDFDVRKVMYRMLTAEPTGAKIRDLSNNQVVEVPKLGVDEISFVPVGEVVGAN
jgi:hypothetical protein